MARQGWHDAETADCRGAWELEAVELWPPPWRYLLISPEGRVGWIHRAVAMPPPSARALVDLMDQGDVSPIPTSGWVPAVLSTGRLDLPLSGESFVLRGPDEPTARGQLFIGQTYRAPQIVPTAEWVARGSPPIHMPMLHLRKLSRLPD